MIYKSLFVSLTSLQNLYSTGVPSFGQTCQAQNETSLQRSFLILLWSFLDNGAVILTAEPDDDLWYPWSVFRLFL